MRARALIAFVLLLLPVLAEAQRLPRIGRRPGPTRGEPNPPQPPSVARELSYKRLNFAVETYPMIAHFDAAGFLSPGATYDWTAFGAGTRVDYRVTRVLSATLDLTSSVIGGPAMTSTAEIGTRLRAPLSEARLYPFADVRFGYMAAFETRARPYDVVDPFNPSIPVSESGRYSRGLGGVAGVGMEYLLTRSVSIVSSGSIMQARMRQHTFRSEQLGPDRYRMTSYRYLLGLRYNPVRSIPRVLANEGGGGS